VLDRKATRDVRRAAVLAAAALLAIGAQSCLGARVDGIFAHGYEEPCGTDCPPPPLTYCERIAADPLVQPAGRTGVIRNWNQAFSLAPFYTSTSYLHPIGSFTMSELPQPGHWLAVAFTATDSTLVTLDWVESQSLVFPVRYNGRPAHSAFLTVSPCPGDFRLADNASSDGFLKRGCRRSANMDSIRFRTDIADSSTSNCALRAGEPYYLNVGFFEPGETDPAAHTCISGTQCEINVQPQ